MRISDWSSDVCSSDLLIPDSQKVAAPQFGDVGFGVAAGQQFGGDVADLAHVFPAFDAAAFVEVRTDANMVDTNLAHGVIDGVAQVLEAGLGFLLQNAVELAGVDRKSVV